MDPNECRDIEQSMFSGTKITKMSQIFAVLTSSALTPYYSYRAFAMQEICSTSHSRIFPRGPPLGNTCVSMTKNFKIGPKSHQNDWFLVEFLKIFRKRPDHLKCCFNMFFDALEVQEHPQSDSGSIWDHSFFMIFLTLFARSGDLWSSFSICLINSLEVCDMQSAFK